MRYGPEHKAEIHQKIVKDAARRVRAEGMTGAAVATVMRDAGLTHGGFYKHFANKDELLLESLQESFREVIETLVDAAERSGSEPAWKAIVKTYLSLEYCEHPEGGCPLPALAPELARVEEGMRGRVFAELVQYRDRMLPYMPGAQRAEQEDAFFVIFSTMMGAMQLARVLGNRAAQERVLGAARDFLLRSF